MDNTLVEPRLGADAPSLRVGVIAPPWGAVPPHQYGGTELVVDRIASGLDAAGHDVRLFATGDSSCPVDRRWVLDEAVPDRIGSSQIEALHVASAYDALSDCDLIHDHTLFGPLYGRAFDGVPVVTTNHGPFEGELADLYRRIGQHAAVIAISHHQAASASCRVAAVIHHGIDATRFSVGPGRGGYLAFLGRMTPDKGPHVAVDIARRTGMPLILAGKCREPAEQEFFDDQVRPHLGGDITYIGEVDFDGKLDLLTDALALLNPIQWPEPFGLVMVEALACGTPVIAFPNGAAPEIVRDGDNGFLCSDADAMVDACSRAGDLDRSACRSAVDTYFNADRMVADHVALYRRLIETATPARRQPAGASARRPQMGTDQQAPRGDRQMPDPTTLLTQDHRKVESLFARYRQEKQESLAQQICTELKIHTKIEEQVVYPVLESLVPSGAEMKQHAEDEHAQVEKLITQIERENFSGGRTHALMEQVMSEVMEHVGEEESDILPRLEAAASREQLDELGAQLESAKQEQQQKLAQPASHADGLVDLTKEELYQRARRMGIQGRSNMNKDQLIDALQHAR